jgi:hypothetical protein
MYLNQTAPGPLTKWLKNMSKSKQAQYENKPSEPHPNFQLIESQPNK